MNTILALFTLLILSHSINIFATELTVEGGIVEVPYNRAAVPGNSGTQFDLADALDESYFYHRIQLAHRFDKQGVRLLYAPLSVSGSSVYSKDIQFNGVTFPAGEKIDVTYQFNSYRASWFYQVDDEGPWKTRLGVTAKVRDAKIKLSQGSQSKFKQNTGVVPLFYLFSEYKFDSGIRLAFDFDGWAAPQGRAFDVALMGGYLIRNNLSVNIGGRMLEGGADNNNSYAFARLHYLFASIVLDF